MSDRKVHRLRPRLGHAVSRLPGIRITLALSLALAWLNLLLTGRWAAVPGALNGAKFPYVIAALAAASILAWFARPARLRMRVPAGAAAVSGVLFLVAAFFTWFPPSTWTLIPFLDDWPPRFKSTVDGVRLLRDGPFLGWRWEFLGGYPMSTDVTQDLTFWAAIPMWLFGAEIGFHAVHLLLFLAIPLLVWIDLGLARERSDVKWLATGLAALFATSYSYTLIRSGDTNSLAGAVSAFAALVAAHAARTHVRGGAIALIVALTVANNSHRGFFVYALLFLALDAVVSRDWRSAGRAVVAAITATAISLPRTWDLWAYPSFYIINNVELHPSPLVWSDFLRKVYYNVELLWQPGRWLNDASGLAHISLPILVFASVRAPRRARFFALAALGVLALVRLNHSTFAYAFIRPVHLLPIFLAAPLAWFVVRCTGRRVLALTMLVFLALYIQVWLVRIPHVRDVRDFDAELVSRISQSDGHLVLVENAFHRDVDTNAQRDSLPTPFGAHYEVLLPEATGHRLYAGMWDGWQWTPYRDQVFANGTFRGQALSEVSEGELIAELRRWGVRHLLVWSERAKRYLDGAAGFRATWGDERWQEFELIDADTRPVAVGRGDGSILETTPFEAVVRLTGVPAGEVVSIRTNYHPAWRAEVSGRALPLASAAGQLSFAAPGGDVDVRLVYPRPRWPLVAALCAAVAGALTIRLFSARHSHAGMPLRLQSANDPTEPSAS